MDTNLPPASEVDRSDAADAKRMRWLLNGNGYFMEEQMLCGAVRHSQREQDEARITIDEKMKEKP